MGTIDGTTELGGSLGSTLGVLDEPEWGPSRFEAYQLKDVLDLRAWYADGTTNTVLRLLSNLEAHFYGELILHDGAIRSINTMSIACITNDEDVVSFRAGDNTGEQVARIDSLGSYSIDGPLGTGAALTASGLQFNLDFKITGLSSPGGTPTPSQGTVEVTDLLINATDATNIVSFQTGASPSLVSKVTSDGSYVIPSSMELSSSSLLFYSTFTLKGDTGSGPPGLVIDVDSLDLFVTSTSATNRWGTFTTGSDVRKLTIAATDNAAKSLNIVASNLSLSFDISGTPTQWGIFKFGGSERTLHIGATSSSYSRLVMKASDLDLVLDNAGSPDRWGVFSTNGSHIRKLSISEVVSGTTTAKNLLIEAADLAFRDSGVGADWGHLWANTTTGSWLQAYNHLNIQAQTTGGSPTWKNINLSGDNIALLTSGSSGKVQIKDSTSPTPVVRYEFNQSAGLALTAPSSSSALIQLDSTATATTGKKWELKSDHTDGYFRLTNITGSKTLLVTADCSLYSPAFLGTGFTASPGGSAPGSGDGQPGAMVIDYDKTKLYVKVDSSTWKYITLT